MSERFVQNARLALWSLVLFALCLGLDTRHHRFPFFYHPDEPGKVRQVRTGEWNFHHPMLLLTATKMALKFSAAHRTEQDVVEFGRWVSAAFVATAVVALSLLAFLWRGWPGAFTAGAVLGLHHQFYELAHYMKEDSAILMGLAATFLGAAMYWQTPSRNRAAFFGAACALAISGKYLGVLALGLAVPLFWRKKGAGAWAFALALLATFALVNLPLLTHLATFQKSFGREMEYVVHGQRGMTRSVPHAQYWSVFLDNTTPAIWLLLGVFLVARWRERRAVTLNEWLLIAFPFCYALALSFSPKSNDRYFLPASALFTLFAVLGVEDAAHFLAGKVSRRRVMCAGGALLVVFQITGWSSSRPGLWQYEEAFQHDDLKELIGWVKTELPPDAVIACDNRVGLPGEKKKDAARRGLVPQKILRGRFAADFGELSELRGKGITHVAVSESDYGKFFLESLRPQTGELPDFERRKTFYEELFREGALLWERDRGTVIYLHPGIRVYRLRG